MRKVVSQFGQGPLQQKLTTGDLEYLSDAEVSRGGTGTGPSPHEYSVSYTHLTLPTIYSV